MIRILFAEDHPIYRAGVHAALQHAGCEIVAETDRGANILPLLLKTQPDFLLLDLNLVDPTFDPAALVRQLRTTMPALKIVVLSAQNESFWIKRMIAAGANGYVYKGDPPRDLIDGIYALHQTQVSRWYSRTAADSPTRRSVLDDEQISLLQSLASGKTDLQIAREIGISKRTIQRHIRKICDELNVASRNEAISKALREGWI